MVADVCGKAVMMLKNAPSGSTGFDVFSFDLFVVARTGVRISLGSGYAAIGAADFPWPAPGECPRRLGQFDPGMALRHEGFRLAQLGDDIFGQLDRAGGVPQSGLRRVIFPANELTKIRFAGGSPVGGGPWGYTIHSSLWT